MSGKNEKVLILDVPGKEGLRGELESFGLTVTEGAEMTRAILAWPGWAQFDPKTTMLVFPGNGASIVKGYIPDEWFAHWPHVYRVYAKRYWTPGSPPSVVASRVFPDRMVLGAKDIVVIDDVVSSGTTAHMLHYANAAWIPGARWHLATWIGQLSAKCKKYEQVYAANWYGTKDTKAPINSLSTLIEVPEIAENYAQRQLGEEAERFLAMLAR